MACFYRAVVDYRQPESRQAPRDRNDDLAKGFDLAAELIAILHRQGPVLEAALNRKLTEQGPGGGRHQSIGSMRRVIGGISYLADLFEAARREREGEIRRGSGLSKQTQLIHTLAKGLQGIGREPDARERGELCNLVSIALEAAAVKFDDQPADLGRTVRAALKTLEKPS